MPVYAPNPIFAVLIATLALLINVITMTGVLKPDKRECDPSKTYVARHLCPIVKDNTK